MGDKAEGMRVLEAGRWTDGGGAVGVGSLKGEKGGWKERCVDTRSCAEKI